MKLLFQTLLSTLLIVGTLYGQSFEFIASSPEPDTIFLDANSVVDFTINFDIKNTTTSDTLELLAERVENNMATGHSSFFCWDLCYDTTVDVSEFPISLFPGDTTRFQYVTFVTGGVNGLSSVKMRFSSTDTSLGSIERTYVFSVSGASSTSIQKAETKTIKTYPLPAKEFINISFDFGLKRQPLELVLVNSIGKRVITKKLTKTDQPLRLSTTELPSGMYILKIFEGNQLVNSQKILISD